MKSLIRTLVITLMTLIAATAVAASPQVYIPLGDANQVQVIDAATNQVTGVVEDVSNVHGLAITPDGRSLIAGSMAVIAAGSDAAPAKPASVSEAEHEKHHAKPAASGTMESGISYVSIIDTASAQIVRRVEVGGAVHHVAVSPNGRFAVTTHPGKGGISVIDLNSFKVIRTVETGLAPNYAVFTADGSNLYVSNAGDNSVSEVVVESWAVSRNIKTGGSPEHVVLSPDDRTLYVNNVADGTVSVIPLADGRVARTFPVGSVPHGIDISDDGGTLFASSKDEGKLTAIDLVAGTVRQIALAPAPYHVTAVRGSGTLYVSSRAENRIWVIDQKDLSVRSEIRIGGIGHQMVVAVR